MITSQMFTLVKEFNCANIVSSLKQAIEERPEVKGFITRVLKTKEQDNDLKEWWQKNDTSWPLATCMTVAHDLESSLMLKYTSDEFYMMAQDPESSLMLKHTSDEFYMASFLKAMSDEYERAPGYWELSIPRLIPIVWTQHLLHHEKLEDIAFMYLGCKDPLFLPSSLGIWTFSEDKAIMVTNSIEEKLPSAGYLVFDPFSGLYKTEGQLNAELDAIEDPVARMEKLILTFVPNSKGLKFYCTSEPARMALSHFGLVSRMRAPNPTGEERWI